MKKNRTVLTPEQLERKKAERRITLKQGWKDGIVPFLIQFGAVVVVILQFVFLIANDATPSVPGVPDLIVGGETVNDPNWVRLVYLFFCFPAVFFLLKWAATSENRKKAFWIAFAAAILAWQAIGECSWHFGLSVSGTYLFFPMIEGPQGTFLLLPFAAFSIYLFKTKKLPWYMSVFLLTFLANWAGHWILLGVAPWWPVGAVYHNPAKWPKIAGILFGMHGALMLVYRILFKAKTMEERMMLSIALYTFVGIFLEGALGLGAGLE